jgi:hypothetical protein
MSGLLPRRCQNDACTKMRSESSTKKHRTRKRLDGRPDCTGINGMICMVGNECTTAGMARLVRQLKRNGHFTLRSNRRIVSKTSPVYSTSHAGATPQRPLLRIKEKTQPPRPRKNVHVENTLGSRTSCAAPQTPVTLQRTALPAAPEDTPQHATIAVLSDVGYKHSIEHNDSHTSTDSSIPGSPSSRSSFYFSGIYVTSRDSFLHRVTGLIMDDALSCCPSAQRIRCTSTAVHIMQRLTQTMSANILFQKHRAYYGDVVLAANFADVILMVEGVIQDASRSSFTSVTLDKAYMLQSVFINILGETSCFEPVPALEA